MLGKEEENNRIIKILDIKPEVERLNENTKVTNIKEAISKQIPKEENIEGYSRTDEELISSKGDNAFAAAARLAYQHHINFTLNPDDIWLLITQGFGYFVTKNSEELRDKIVDFEYKMDIIVEAEGFVKGNIENNWESIFPIFTNKIKEHIGEELYSTIIADFSTTTPTTKAASEIVLLYSMKKYFNYITYTACGIPNICIQGLSEDWLKLRAKTMQLGKYFGENNSWISSIIEIINKIVDYVVDGDMDLKFWNSFYKWRGAHGSGGPMVSGWIINLFPYLYASHIGLYPNLHASLPWNKRKQVLDGQFPIGICSVPFIWDYFGHKFNMKFIAGFIAISQPMLNYLKPHQGWAVVQQPD